MPDESNTNTVLATVYFKLSTDGQKTALAAGKPAAKWQALSGPIDIADLDLCQILDDGTVVATTSTIRTRNAVDGGGRPLNLGFDVSAPRLPKPGRVEDADLSLDAPPADAAAVIGILRAHIAAVRKAVAEQERKEDQERIEREAKVEAEYAACLATMQAVLDADPAAIPAIKLPPSYFLYSWTTSNHPIALEITRRQKAKDKAETEAKEAAEAAKAKGIRDWLAAHGTENQVERYDRGLLPDEEMKHAMADWAFAPLNGYPLYEQLTGAEVHAAVDDEFGQYADSKAMYRSTEPESLTEEQWQKLKSMSKTFNKDLSPRLHEGTLEHNDVPWGVVERYGAVATATVAGVEVRREYAL